MTPYLVPAGERCIELTLKNSRFIACAAPADTVEAARSYIARIKITYPDATHHVPAFLIGSGASVISHCNDDGEPSGTAGRPVLAALSASGFGDIVVVVTRYFGGIKLGTAGLARAYRDATLQVLAELPRAYKIAAVTFALDISYPWFERTQELIRSFHGHLLTRDFGAQISLTAQIPADQFERFKLALAELTHGQSHVLLLSTSDTIEPMEDF